MRRVSSRPRLVSDADRAFQNASLDLDHIDHHNNNYHISGDGDIDDGHELLHKSQGGRQQQQQQPHVTQAQQQQQGYYSYFVFNDDLHHGHDDDDDVAGNNNSSRHINVNNGEEYHKKKSPPTVTSATAAAAVLINSNDEDSSFSDDDDNNSLSNYLSCNDLSTLEISFSKKTSLSSNEEEEEEGGSETAALTSAAAAANNLSGAAAPYSVKRKRLSQSPPLNHHHHQQQQQQQQQHYLTPNSSYAELLPTVVDIVQTFPTTTIKNSHNTTAYTTTYTTNTQHMSQYQYYNKDEEVVKGYHHHHQQHQHQAATAATLQQLLLNQLPSETLLNITTYLPHSNIRTLSMTNKHLRHVIMCSVASHSEIWMRYLQDEFPYVFVGNNTSHLSNKNVKLVDDFHLPTAGVSSSSQGGSVEHRVNLPLLTGLLVQRYPQEVDLNSTGGRGGGGGSVRGRRGSNGDDGGELFRSFYMNIPAHHTHTTTASGGHLKDDAADNVVTSSVPVIQFTGRAGTGDRSIRSDKPFPPNCRVIAHSNSQHNNDSGAGSGSSSNGGVGGLRSISTWMKNHTPLRSRGNKRKSGRRSSSSATSALLRREDSSSSPPRRHHHHHALFPNYHASTNNTSMTVFPAMSLSLSPSARRNVLIPPPLSATAATPTTIIPPPPPSQRSPLFRFLSSLSHHCTSVSSSNNSSFVDNDETFDDMDNGDIIGRSIDRTFSMDPNDGSEDGDDDDEDDIGVNDYGMMLRSNGHGLLEQCKLKFGKMCDGHCNKSTNNLRPFVIPTVVASSAGGERTVDVTPRLVAYFEVTILDQQGEEEEEEGTSNNNRGVHNARRQPLQQPPPAAANVPNNHGHNERPRRENPLPRRRDIPRHNNHQLWGRVPHRVFPPIHLPLPFDPVFFAPLEQEVRVAQAAADALREQLQPRDHRRDRLFVPNFDQQQRHDCVAIGLSTLSFNPRSKMPGWDNYSFGYHGDDGGIFHGHGDMLRALANFGPGDTVGCGLEYSTRRIFFVKNGEFLGYAFENIDKEMVERGLYPTVGVDTECPIHVNFGQVPFKFDWKKFGKEKLYV